MSGRRLPRPTKPSGLDWTQEMVAKHLGLSNGTVSELLRIAGFLHSAEKSAQIYNYPRKQIGRRAPAARSLVDDADALGRGAPPVLTLRTTHRALDDPQLLPTV